MRKEIKRVKVLEQEINLIQAAHLNYYNYESLAAVLASEGKLTEELFDKIKTEYLKYAYDFAILKEAIGEKYGDGLNCDFEILYREAEIIFYEEV